jgi:predicted lipoprotein with Yx(FWY)xxD motif
MRCGLLVLMIAALGVAGGCGDDGKTPPGEVPQRQETSMRGDDDTAAAKTAMRGDDDTAAAKTRRTGTTVTVRRSEFGEMLFDSRRQAIYVFEKDPKGETVCYGECAAAWPPVVTKGRPVAGKGVDAGLLGTVERRDGTRQVTYAGKPLYYYAHEEPGEVRCHNVNLNGGFWWVVGPDGRRLA